MKRCFHCIMRAEHGARDFRRRDETRRKQIAIILRFFSKLCVISLPSEIFTSFTRSFYFILQAERSLCVFQRGKKTEHTQIATIRRFFRYLSHISHPFEIFTTFKRCFHCIMRAEHGARDFQRRDEARRTHIAIIRRFCR